MKSIRELYKIGFGPSSSHTMGPQKCCEYVLKKYEATNYKVILFGSLALTGKGHLTDYIIKETLKNVEIEFDYLTEVAHPNTLKITSLNNDKVIAEDIFYSVGGGDILINTLINAKKENVYPVSTFDATKKVLQEDKTSLLEYILKFEEESIYEYIKEVKDVMFNSIKKGLSKEGVLPGKLLVHRKAKSIYSKAKTFKEKILAYAYAVNEENAAGGMIVTAPTCGASGVIPALLFALSEEFNYSEQKQLDALLIAGFFGCLIKENASISGAEAGCQAEVGSATAMGAAMVSFLNDCSLDIIEQSAEVALEHNLGLTCDPILGYVQIPCIERNAVAATYSYECSMLSKLLDEGTSKITFDLVCKTMLETGKDLQASYRETSIGGLAKHYEKK